jgi:hypothetical protein
MWRYFRDILVLACSSFLAPTWLHAQPVRTGVEHPEAPKQFSGDDPTARRDLYGDPLPPGAILRIGSVRLQHGHSIQHLAFSPDQKIRELQAPSSRAKRQRHWSA